MTAGRFFLPGPTEVHPEVLAAQLQPMIGHRGEAVQALIERSQEGLGTLFGTRRPVFISTSSATGLMEGAIRNGSVRRVLALVNGAFGERFARIAEACGREVERLAVAWGEAHGPAEVADRLSEGDFDAVTVVHSETSTGVLQHLAELSEAVRSASDAFLLVDSVTGVGGTDVQADEWKLDFVLTGSQKALALPPGLAFGVASERLMDRARTLPDRGVYFDFAAHEDRLERMQTPNTPAISTLYALVEQLRRIRAEGLAGRLERHRSMARRCWEWVDEMRPRGVLLEMLPREGDRSPTVSCVRLPDGCSGPAVAGRLAQKGWVIGAGYGKLKERTIRVGHMGDRTMDELNAMLAALAEVFTEMST